MEGYVGRGRGHATNVPEIELIEQVKIRPLLYDKNVKDYRKSDASEQAWKEVANALQTTITNCKKRWKSLRDTFIKYYRLDVTNRDGTKKHRKNWVYFKDLSFLIPHVELFRLDESMKTIDQQQQQQQQNDSIPIYLKEDYLDEKHLFFTEEEHPENDDQSSMSYEIKVAKSDYNEEHISESIEEDTILDGNYVEERLEDSTISLEDHVEMNKVIRKLSNSENTYMLIEQSTEEEAENMLSKGSQVHSTNVKIDNLESPSNAQKNVIDPDERYLLSCLPAFKRLTPQQKGLIRMGIERLFYEVEFQNDYEPKSKKARNS